MKAGIVVGAVVAARVAEGLKDLRFVIVLPVDENDAPAGNPLVACDVVGAGVGTRVAWVSGKEAALALPNPACAVDATCVAILEKHSLSEGP